MATRISILRTTCRYRLTKPYTRFASYSSSSPSSNTFRNIVGLITIIGTGTILTTYYLDSRSTIHRYVVPPLLRATLDSEDAHRFAVRALGLGLGPRDPVKDDESLETELWGYKVSNPISLAAGFDKDGEAIDGLFQLGFGWVEIGSVTPKAQPGNPKPRFFHLADDSAIINRYGFPSVGFPLVISRLRSYLTFSRPSHSPDKILAVNLGKNKSSSPDSVSDYIAGVKAFGPLADVLVINVSSPNTPGLRGLQSRGLLVELLLQVVRERDALEKRRVDLANGVKWERPKLVVKIAPDLNEEELRDVAEAVRESGIDGVIVSNTTVQRPSSLVSEHRGEIGGLSGPPLLPLSLAALRTLRTLLPAETPIFGCGGITTGSDALEFAKAGASAVQLYTAFGYGGAGVPRRLKDELVEALKKEGTTWGAVVNKTLGEVAGSRIEEVTREEVLKREAEELKAEAEELGRILDLVEKEAGSEVGEDVKRAVEELGEGIGEGNVEERREARIKAEEDGEAAIAALTDGEAATTASVEKPNEEPVAEEPVEKAPPPAETEEKWPVRLV